MPTKRVKIASGAAINYT